MTAREYLEQAFRLDVRINAKLELLESLSALATKATYTHSQMPKSPNRATSFMANTVAKIVDLQADIDQDIDCLVDLKQEIVDVIKAVDVLEYRMLLELRYLCFKSWEQIAVELGYSIQHVYRMRNRALAKIKVPKSKDESK